MQYDKQFFIDNPHYNPATSAFDLAWYEKKLEAEKAKESSKAEEQIKPSEEQIKTSEEQIKTKHKGK